jgi:antitoxin component YwqK of YwqJK toxin-antitoxin module
MEITYDKETSNILSKQAYKEDGSRGSKSEYTYDEQWNELTYIATLSDGTVDFYREYTYNAQGQLESNTYGWGEQSPQYRDVFTYDNHGNKLSQLMYVSGEYDSEITYENRYENDKLVEIKTYHDGILRWGEKYDADGLLIAEDQYTYEGEVFSTTTYTYENGKILLRIVSNEGAESFRQEYTYTDDGQLAEVAYFDQGSFCGRDVYTYENGSLVKVEMYDHQELENQYILTYKKANVTEEQAEKLTALYETILEF